MIYIVGYFVIGLLLGFVYFLLNRKFNWINKDDDVAVMIIILIIGWILALPMIISLFIAGAIVFCSIEFGKKIMNIFSKIIKK